MSAAFSSFVTRSCRVLFVVAAVLCGHSNITAQERMTIRIASQNLISEDTIRLASIAAISGPVELAEKLRKVSLGYAPDVGATRVIRRQQIMLALQAAGFDPNAVRLEAEEAISVSRNGQRVSGTDLRAKVEEAMLKNFRDIGVDARFSRLDLPEDLQVPEGDIDIRVNSEGIRNPFEVFSLTIDVRVNGRSARTLPVRAAIEAFAEVFVAGVNLSPKDEIMPSAVRLERIRLVKPIDSYVRDARKLRGTSVIREINAGTPLTIDAIASVVVVRPGDIVRIETGSQSFQIVVSGEANAAGRIGDRIAVKNAQTGAVLQATVVDKGIVRVGI